MNTGERCNMYTLRIAISRRGCCARKARLWISATIVDGQGHRYVAYKKLCFRCMTAYARWIRKKAESWKTGRL